MSNCPVDYYQDETELDYLIRRAGELRPRKIMEVGSLYGGTLWRWMQAWPGATVVSVDMIAVDVPEHPKEKILAARRLWQSWAKESGCELQYFVGPSDHPLILQQVEQQAPFDFIFVDGGHAYEQVAADFRNYWPMLRPGGIMAFHDIAYQDGYPGIGVGTWWRGLSAQMPNHRMIDIRALPDTWGIGVIWK